MDTETSKSTFTSLREGIQWQAEKSLCNLVELAHVIENVLTSDAFVKEEPAQQCNLQHLNGLMRPVQAHLRDFIEIVEHLTLWLELEIPPYSESDDFRIVVQNEILDEIASMKASCIAHLGHLVDYREQRASASKELFKRPQLDDNRHLISNLDCQLKRNLKLMLMETKSFILRICNLLTKNKHLIDRQSSHRQHMNNYF